MKKNNMKSILMLASLALIVTSVIGTTIAYLVSNEVSVTNTFTAAQVSNEVEENFGGTTKSDVKIQNTGDIPAYIRVALICTWKDAENNFVSEPAYLEDLNIVWGELGKDGDDADEGYWVESAGYYYYNTEVPAGGFTGNLIDSATVKTANGYQFNLEIISSAIQAEPIDAVKDAWKVDPTTLKSTN